MITGQPAWYRLTPDEYLTHLQGHDTPYPGQAIAVLPRRYTPGFVDAAHATAYHDADGFIWTLTTDLRVSI